MKKLDDFSDALLRAILIEQVSQTSKYSSKLEKFIITNLTQEQVISSLFQDTKFIKEAFLSTDIEREMALEKIEPFLKLALTLGFAFYFGYQTEELISKGLSKTGLKTFKEEPQNSDNQGKKQHQRGIVSTGITAWIMHNSAGIVSKVLKVLITRAFLVCNRNCERSVSHTGVALQSRELIVKICTKKCRIAGIEKILNKLHSDSLMCDSTKNPWRCKSTLYSKIGELQDRLEQEKEDLKKLYEIQKLPTPDVSKPVNMQPTSKNLNK
jgi:hypothetical protein